MCYAAGSLLNRILGQVSAPQCPPWTISSGPVFVLQIAAAGRPFSASVGLLLALEIKSSKPPCSISWKLAKQWVDFHSSALELSLPKRGWKSSSGQVWTSTSLAFSCLHSCKLTALICRMASSWDSSHWARLRSDSRCKTVKRKRNHMTNIRRL